MFEAAVAGALALCSKSPKHALPPLSPASPVQASSPQVQYFEPLSQEQKKHCIQLNICFRCRQHGHSSYHGSCPNNDWRARSRELPSTPSAAAQSSQLPASTTLASAPRPRRSRASPTSRTSTLKSQLESLTSLFTALEEQPAGYAEGAAIEIVAVQCHLSTSSTGASHRVTDYSSTAICRARSNLTDHHAAGHSNWHFRRPLLRNVVSTAPAAPPQRTLRSRQRTKSPAASSTRRPSKLLAFNGNHPP
ncbi:uncharacterized protein MYCGRDRAFT_97605 [Zymoseptoria tritici IPO323]|uniref:Uncharacterized protein n=1 Tax=Zymoseptoria tritici (strain CBS 115943 / IPO323) TaxID=336722 RepID=F9XQT6_ZYMTI|nr:uncharacterized protein MYCGRDRAFT_97605 [Zymoseptoria tritici IPO323]EGP82413.1 hypothetical protein MYCGRDRAFT_97605 [Zymoseptoria tritici IPO323]